MNRDISATNASPATTGGVQSLHRALDLFEIVARNGGQLAIGEMATASGIPLPTIHRLLRTLVERGYMRQLPTRRYALGFRLVPLGDAANALAGLHAKSVLSELVAELGETANLAILSGDHAEYIAQVPSAHSMRMFTEVGRRVDLHCTGVGKAVLAQLDNDAVRKIVRRAGLKQYTEHTLTSESALNEALSEIRRNGYAMDDEEMEPGVRCVAVPFKAPMRSWIAVSISGPVGRMTDALVARSLPLLQAAADRLGQEFAMEDDA